ncbi:putative essential cytoplasmic protein [Golovinomyces cichoracearum]|uniref:Ataxin-10 homolog n=1 Tax=Golovinomyces cichoracearum TaxID=62708 RepID=A0A420IFI2_9PEZI|nr:putative essential cytoplasmic protein [Golovinomyces cichoracearum]
MIAMFCIECGNPLPAIRDNHTICSKCKTPLSTWWDESSATFRTNRETILPDNQIPFKSHLDPKEMEMMAQRKNTQSPEERAFNAALICLEHHFDRPMNSMTGTMDQVRKIVSTTLDLSLKKADIRERLAKNVDVWMHLRNILTSAVTLLEKWSLRASKAVDGIMHTHDVSESTDLILSNYENLQKDLHFLNSLLIISRNMLAVKETAQELCAAVQVDKAVHKIIGLCIDITSKGYDGETVDETKRARLNDISEFYKKLLVTCLQHTHNWTMGNDRFKMSFWFDMLFDEDLKNDSIHGSSETLNVEIACQEVSNWLRRQQNKDKVAVELLEQYRKEETSPYSPGPLPDQNDIPEGCQIDSPAVPVWKPELEDKFEQDRLYARVSHEIDTWWKRVRDPNFEGWVTNMETVLGAQERAAVCKENTIDRYILQTQAESQYEPNEHFVNLHDLDTTDTNEIDTKLAHDEVCDDEEEEEEDEDDDSYVEGSLRGLLTEIPNILDTKQIEALHMTVKACIVDSMGSGLTPVGENLQKTRCKMFLALDCGKNLLRELLVFIAVWEQTDQQFIFQITAQVIESFHHNALLPYAWDSLRILKDIVSPAQTVLLRLINYMFRARKDSPIYDDVKDYNRDAKLIHYLYSYFRCRVVPDCLALIHAQAQIRHNKRHPSDFPVDSWDMERTKDGLAQYLDFISVVAEISEMRHLLIEWEAVYELIALLKALEAGVARKSFDERPITSQNRRSTPENSSMFSFDSTMSTVNIPPLQDAPYKFAWPGVKNQILIILTTLISPISPRRTGPGNPIVQKQLLAHEGIMPLLNCCVYDGNNEYLKERATLTMKFLMEGCKEAQDFVKELVPVKQAQVQAQAAARAQAELQTHSKEKNKLQTSRVTTNKTNSLNTQLSTPIQTSLTTGAQEVEAKIKELERNIKLASQIGGNNATSNTDNEKASRREVKNSGVRNKLNPTTQPIDEMGGGVSESGKQSNKKRGS